MLPEKKHSVWGSRAGNPRPGNLDTDFQKLVAWEEWYERLWKFKDITLKKNNR
jgi:hypothetical protein